MKRNSLLDYFSVALIFSFSLLVTTELVITELVTPELEKPAQLETSDCDTPPQLVVGATWRQNATVHVVVDPSFETDGRARQPIQISSESARRAGRAIRTLGVGFISGFATTLVNN